MPRPPGRNLVVRPNRTCSSCGRTVARSDILLGDPPRCAECLFGRDGGHDGAAGDERRRRLLEALADRQRVGRRFGNDCAVAYPSGIDLTLRTLFDDLRRYLVEVRVEVRTDDGDVVVHDGHLRRTDDTGGVTDYLQWWPARIGFYVDPSDLEPHAVLPDEEFENIIRISVIDRLLVGRDGARVIWEPPAEKRKDFEARKAARGRRERWLVVLLLIHVTLVLAVLIGGIIPFYRAYRDHRVLDATGWGLIWWFASVAVGSSLGAWDQFPRPSALFQNDRPPQPTVGPGRGQQDSTGSGDQH